MIPKVEWRGVVVLNKNLRAVGVAFCRAKEYNHRIIGSCRTHLSIILDSLFPVILLFLRFLLRILACAFRSDSLFIFFHPLS